MAVLLSEKAANEVKKIMTEQKLDPSMFLRVGVSGGGCSGFSYSLGFDSAFVAVNTGAIAGSGNFTPKLQESDDGTTFTDVAASDMTGALPSVLAATATVKAGYIGNKRYIRTVLTNNSGTSIAASAVVIKGHAVKRPVA